MKRFGMATSLLVFLLIFFISPLSPHSEMIENGSETLIRTRSSTIPSSPIILTQTQETIDYYPLGDQDYYYKTLGSGYPYHVVWIYPDSPTDDHDLYLYGDSVYTNLLTHSTRGPGMLDWVVFDWNYSVYYPKVYAHSGSAGSAYLEWDINGNTFVSLGEQKYDFLNVSDQIEIYAMYLQPEKSYDFALTVPSEGDFDFYLYYIEPDGCTNSSSYVVNCSSRGLGIDEVHLSYTPSVSWYHVALVVWQSGNGTYSLSYELSTTPNPDPIPGYDLLIALFGVVCASLVLKKLHLLRMIYTKTSTDGKTK